MTSSAPARRPTRDEAIKASGRVAAEMWLGLTDEQRAEIIAETDAAKAETRQAS